MADKPSDTAVGREALKMWAEMRAEDRDEIRAAFRLVAPDTPEPSLALFVLDGALPANNVASIIEDPINSDHQVLVFSRQTYSDAAFVLARNALVSTKMRPLLRQLGRLDITDSAIVIAPDRSSLFELGKPDRALLKTTESLTHLITVAKSSESVDIPDVGHGKLYRF